MEEPPIPIAIPSAAIKKDTGRTTLVAAMATEPIQLPTKMVSTNILRDITKIPMEAGTACLTNKLPMLSSPIALDELRLIELYVLLGQCPLIYPTCKNLNPSIILI